MPNDEIHKMLDENVTLSLWPDAAKVLGLKRDSAYAAAAAGQIRTIRFGRLLKVPTSHLRELLGLTESRPAG
jgi:excisionase family DNA binding protein